jgi:hypothetical protein
MKYTLPSGAELEVTLLDFEPAFEISQIVTKFVGLLDIDLKSLEVEKWTSISDVDVNAIKRPLSQILSNSDLVKAANKCLVKCLYNNIRISDKTWNEPSARKDYYHAMFYALKDNIFPFFEGVFSSSKV